MEKKKVLKTYSHSTQHQKGRQTQLSDLFDVVLEAPSVKQSRGIGKSNPVPPERGILGKHPSFDKGANIDKEENKQSPRTALFIDENDPNDDLHTTDHTSGTRAKRFKQMLSKRSGRNKFGRSYSSVKRLKNIGWSPLKLYQKSESGKQSSSSTMCEKYAIKQTGIEVWRKDPFAGKENVGVGWNFVQKGEETEHKPSFSLSDSASSLPCSPPSTHTRPVISFDQQWKHGESKMRSFIKIRTPGPKVLSSLCLNTTDGEQEISLPSCSQITDTSSYTSVYTWTTATDSAPQAGVENMQKENLQVQNAASLSLAQQTCTNEYLHSTAIKLNVDTCLQQTPLLSPIVPAKDWKKKDATPSRAKSQIFPRCPRKVYTSASGSSHKFAPKCSTMLFASSTADVGDISLDISSIRNTESNAVPVAGAQDATLVTGKGSMKEPCQTGKDSSGQILTSTPLSNKHKIKFVLDLSSLQSPSDCEINPLRVSADVVHSDEIVAESLEDSCRCVSEIKIDNYANNEDVYHNASTIRSTRSEKPSKEKIHNVPYHQDCTSTGVRDVNMDYHRNEKQQDAISEVCPISMLGMSESATREHSRKVSKAGIFLWIEPADSGFMDMLQSTPPDDISLLSYQSVYGIKR